MHHNLENSSFDTMGILILIVLICWGKSSEYKGLRMHAQLFSGDRVQSFGLSLLLLPYFVCVRREGSWETLGMFRPSEPLLFAAAKSINLVCWSI